MNTTVTHDPKAWVGCLACYNAGRLVGEWVDGTEAGELTTEDLHSPGKPGTPAEMAEIRADLALAPHEELWVFDHEDYGGLLTGECSPVEATNVAEAINAIEEDGHPLEAVAAWLDNTGDTLSDADAWVEHRDAFAGAYRGEWDSLADYAQDFYESTGELQASKDSPLLAYIDWERVGRDFELGGDVFTVENPAGGLFVFTAY